MRRTKAEVEAIKAAIYQFCEQYHPVTVRQTFYGLTVRNHIAKTEQEYKNVVRWAKDMRLAGELPWEWLADNTRWMHKPKTYGGLQDLMDASQQGYRRALWDPSKNPNYVEIWLEKDALTGVFDDVTDEYDVPLMPCRGYPSLSFVRSAAHSIVQNIEARCGGASGFSGVKATIYYFGDFDPSGCDISRSTEARLREFVSEIDYPITNEFFDFKRVAINHEQIEEMDLPTRPTKKGDSRSKNFGHDISVELDAIEPTQLKQMIRDCITPHIDMSELERLRTIEAQERKTLNLISQFTRTNGVDALESRLGV